MTSRSSYAQRPMARSVWHRLFGGPLLRLPGARTREARRLRMAMGASVAFHGVLFVGGALVTAGGILEGGGTVAGIEIVIDTRGLDSGPMPGRSYAPPPEASERASAETEPERQPAEESTPQALDQPPVRLAEADLSESLPDVAPDLPVEVSRAPDRLDAPPEQLETPRGIAPFLAPPTADADPVPVVEQPQPPASPDQPPPLLSAALPEPVAPATPTVDSPQSPPAVTASTADVVPAPTIVETAPDQPATPTPPVLAAAPTPPLEQTAATPPPVEQSAPTPLPAEMVVPEPAVATPPAVDPPTQPVLASLTAPPPVVRSLADPAPSVDTPPDLEIVEPQQAVDQPPPPPEDPLQPIRTETPLALTLPPPPPDLDAPPPEPELDSAPPIGPVTWDQPFAAPAYDPRIADGLTAAQTGRSDGPDAEINAILSEITCGDLSADVGDNGQIAVRGYVTSIDEQANIRDQLRQLDSVSAVADDDVVVIGETLCGGLDTYAGGGGTLASDPAPMDHLPPALRSEPLFGLVQGARAAFAETQFLEIYVTTPDYPAYVYIDFFKPNGEVVHLLPSELTPDNRRAPESTIPITAGEPDSISVPAGPPFGTGMVVTLSTNSPLFAVAVPRDRVEPADVYLAALDEALADRERDPTFESQYGYVFVEAIPQ